MVSIYAYNIKISTVCLILIFSQHNFFACGYKCYTKGSIPGGRKIAGADRLNTYNPKDLSLWPIGRIKYVLSGPFTKSDEKELDLAFQDYHKKTCIRFELKKPSDKDVAFVNFQINDTVANGGGLAEVCRVGREQYAWFGGATRPKNLFVHELGHTLCLRHEHQRKDRDDYLRYGATCTMSGYNEKHDASSNAVGLFDYQSVMHYSCNNCFGGTPIYPKVKTCSTDAEELGLSVLDADQINRLYNCQGCFRHRWRSAGQLTAADRANLPNFGINDSNGKPIYVCRVFYEGQIVVGMFVQASSKCVITDSNKVHEIRNNIEVLTVPGGLSQHCYAYKVVDGLTCALNEAIPAAGNVENMKEKMYIAYGYGWRNGVKNVLGVGRVWASNSLGNHVIADVPYNSKVVSTSGFGVLTCSLDTQCLSKRPVSAGKYISYSDENNEQNYENPKTFDNYEIRDDVANGERLEMEGWTEDNVGDNTHFSDNINQHIYYGQELSTGNEFAEDGQYKDELLENPYENANNYETGTDDAEVSNFYELNGEQDETQGMYQPNGNDDEGLMEEESPHHHAYVHGIPGVHSGEKLDTDYENLEMQPVANGDDDDVHGQLNTQEGLMRNDYENQLHSETDENQNFQQYETPEDLDGETHDDYNHIMSQTHNDDSLQNIQNTNTYENQGYNEKEGADEYQNLQTSIDNGSDESQYNHEAKFLIHDDTDNSGGNHASVEISNDLAANEQQHYQGYDNNDGSMENPLSQTWETLRGSVENDNLKSNFEVDYQY